MSLKTKKNNKNKKNSTRKLTGTTVVNINDKSYDEYKNKCAKFNSRIYDSFEKEFEKQKGLIHLIKNGNIHQEKLINDIKKSLISNKSHILPQNDFYSFVNERWMKETTLTKDQKYIVQIDDFRLVQYKVYLELIDIVKKYIKTNHSKEAKTIKNFYLSQVRFNSNEESKNYALARLKLIDEIREEKNMWKLLAMLNKNEVVSWGSPFTWSINPDDLEPDVYRSYLNSPQLSLIDINIYFDDGTDKSYKENYKKKFFKYLNELFEDSFGKNHGFNVKDVFDVETKIIYAIGCNYLKEKNTKNYNRVTKQDALKIYGFDWEDFSKQLGYEKTPDFFITSNLNYLKCGTDLLLKEWDTDMWRTYFIYIFIRQSQRWNKRGRQLFYEFQGKFVRGQEAAVPESIQPIFGLGYAFNTFISNIYIDNNENIQVINYLKNMAEDLKAVFIRIIKRNSWLQPKTKAYALKKLNHFKFIIGSPKILREDPLLDYSNWDSWGNILKIAQWRHEKAVKLEGQGMIDLPVIDWQQIPPKFIGTQAYVVNAAYTPSKNAIYVPLGYIQEPFIDLKQRGIEWNLAHLGFTLGHEMSHSLDDWGSQYDYNGKLFDWWTAEDKAIFKRIQNDVIKQYEVFAGYDGIKFDAAIGVGEDLADISGLAICSEYLNDFQEKNLDILPIRYLSFRTFFVYYAYQMRQKVNKKALAAQLKTNPHPLDKYRTNVPLSRLPMFRVIYDIKKGDKMWWHTTNRVWQG
jgi:predicted metalloendopeptidase